MDYFSMGAMVVTSVNKNATIIKEINLCWQFKNDNSHESRCVKEHEVLDYARFLNLLEDDEIQLVWAEDLSGNLEKILIDKRIR